MLDLDKDLGEIDANKTETEENKPTNKPDRSDEGCPSGHNFVEHVLPNDRVCYKSEGDQRYSRAKIEDERERS